MPHGDDEILEQLEQMAEDDDPDLHEALLEAVEHPSQAVRVAAALMLAEQFHDAKAVPALHEAIYHGEPRLQRRAADAVWEIGDWDPASLIRALHFARGPVRDAIAEALEMVGWIPDDISAEVTYRIATRTWQQIVGIGPEAVSRLVSALSDPDGNVRRGAVWTLGQIGDIRAVPFLIPMLEDTSGDLFGAGSRVCDVAAEALLRIGTDEAVQAVEAWRASPQAPGAAT
jgi:HEAT repeat protein